MNMPPINSKGVELLEVWPFWRRSVTTGRALRFQKLTSGPVSLSLLALMTQIKNSQLFVQHHACQHAVMFPIIKIMN